MEILLVVNFGGSSFKYRAYSLIDGSLVGRGRIENLGSSYATMKIWKEDGKTISKNLGELTQEDSLRMLFNDLIKDGGLIGSLSDIKYVAHKLAHGGPHYISTALIDEDLERAVEEFASVVPIHNTASLNAIRIIRRVLPYCNQIAVFETEFHKDLPEYATIYGFPYEFKEKYGIRKYGFHGASHRYISEQVKTIVGNEVEEIKLVSCHLGSGTSVAAIHNGKSIEISSGFTPQSGTMMSTRAGDYDGEVLNYLQKVVRMDQDQIRKVLNEESGLKGISGISGDLVAVLKAVEDGNRRAMLAVDAFCYRVRLYIGMSAAALNGVNVLTFTGGIGENSPEIRERIVVGLDYLGLHIDPELNRSIKNGKISSIGSKVKVLLIETDEEIIVAREALKLINKWEVEK